MAKITTTGELRSFLCSTLNGISNGTIDADKARNIVKIAGQINESFYAEVKVARLKIDLDTEIADVGELKIGN